MFRQRRVFCDHLACNGLWFGLITDLTGEMGLIPCQRTTGLCTLRDRECESHPLTTKIPCELDMKLVSLHIRSM